MKSPEMPSQEGEKLQSLEEMDIVAIEEELKNRNITTPPRWFFYTEEQKKSVVQDARDGKIQPGQKWPGDKGDRSVFEVKK